MELSVGGVSLVGLPRGARRWRVWCLRHREARPIRIAHICEEGKQFVLLWCWRCVRGEEWMGAALGVRFAAWPDLTLAELRDRAKCRHCGGDG